MTFLEEVLHFELTLDFVEENRASQPSDDMIPMKTKNS